MKVVWLQSREPQNWFSIGLVKPEHHKLQLVYFSTPLQFVFISSVVIVLTRKCVFLTLPLCLIISSLFLIWNIFILSYFSDVLTSHVFSNRADSIATNRPFIFYLKKSLIRPQWFNTGVFFYDITSYKPKHKREMPKAPRRKPTLLFVLWLRSWKSSHYAKSSHITLILWSESQGRGCGYQTLRWVTETPNKRKMSLMTHISLM